MSKALTLPGRPIAARRSKVDRSWCVLAGTSTAATATLLLWLIVAALIGREGGLVSGLVLAIEPPASVVGLLPPVAGDADLIARAVGRAGSGSAAGLGDLERQLEAMVARGSPPRIVALSAVGVSSSADGEGAKPYFLPIGGDPGDPSSLIPADRVIELLSDRERTGGPTLLILDVAHLDSDRGTAVLANGFLHQLERLIPEDGDLVVLTPCAPGQVSWSAEPFGRSVFADCVARSDAWGRGTVSDLHREVASRVAGWARAHRDAEQTPLLLGNVRRRDFRLPPLSGTVPAPALPAEAGELKQRLRDAWTEHGAMAEAGPARVAPQPWRLYRDELLRAERLFRSGHHAEADLALNAVGALAASLRQQLDDPPPAGLPSFALRIAMAAPGRREAIRAEWESFETAIRRFFDEAGTRPSAPAPPTAVAAEDGQTGEEAAPRGEGAATAAAPTGPGRGDTDEAEGPMSIAELPRVAEGLMALRYAQFIELGGESDELRPDRLEGLRLAFDVAIAGERAAASDGRLLPWVGPIVSEGDRKRLEGQDLLFAADRGLIRSAVEPLHEAQALYAEAQALAGPLTEAVDLLQELADELPYYGEWAASAPSRRPVLGTLLEDTAALADRVAGPPTGRGTLATTREGESPRDDLRDLLGKVRRGYGALRRAFDQEAGSAARPGARHRWRTLDALLRVPSIPVEARMALLDAATLAELSPLPAPEAVGDSTGARPPDDAFWDRALGLARLEMGLLRIAGEPIDELRGYLGTAESWRTSHDAAFGAMDSLSQGIRRHRDALLHPGGHDDESRGTRSGRGELDRADWLARTLPAATLHGRFGPSEGPSAARSALNRHELLVWHGRRLSQDLAQDLARDALLAANALGVESPELAEARLELDRGRSSTLRVESLAAGGDAAGNVPGLAISGGQGLPEGRAAVLLTHDPDIDLRARPRNEAVVSIPLGDRVERRFDIDFAEGVDVVPAVFYRGQVFDSGRVSLPQIEQVSVAVRQLFTQAVDNRGNEILVRGRKIKIPDQFEEHPGEGYLHPNSSLEYRLELTNWTADSLPVIVSQQWEGGPIKEDRVVLPPGQSVPKAATGRISTIDLGAEGTPRTLTVEVREDGGLGRTLCKPEQVIFRQLDPEQYITIHPLFSGDRISVVGLFVQHLDEDRTTVPSHVTMAVEPFSAVYQLEAPLWIERGSYAAYRYRIVDPKVKSLKFSLNIDGVPDAIVREYSIQSLPEEPPLRPDDPKVPKL